MKKVVLLWGSCNIERSCPWGFGALYQPLAQLCLACIFKRKAVINSLVQCSHLNGFMPGNTTQWYFFIILFYTNPDALHFYVFPCLSCYWMLNHIGRTWMAFCLQMSIFFKIQKKNIFCSNWKTTYLDEHDQHELSSFVLDWNLSCNSHICMAFQLKLKLF